MYLDLHELLAFLPFIFEYTCIFFKVSCPIFEPIQGCNFPQVTLYTSL